MISLFKYDKLIYLWNLVPGMGTRVPWSGTITWVPS